MLPLFWRHVLAVEVKTSDVAMSVLCALFGQHAGRNAHSRPCLRKERHMINEAVQLRRHRLLAENHVELPIPALQLQTSLLQEQHFMSTQWRLPQDKVKD